MYDPNDTLEKNQVNDALGIEAEEPEEELTVTTTSEGDEDKNIDTSSFSKTQLKAHERGWLPKEYFKGDPEAWTDAYQYIQQSDLIRNNVELKRELEQRDKAFNDELQKTQAYLKLQNDERIKELEHEKREAMRIADEDEYDRLDKEIKRKQEAAPQIQPAAPVVTAGLPPEVQEWEAKNQWVHDTKDPRTAKAQNAYKSFLAANPGDVRGAIAYVDYLIKPTAASANVRRETASTSETPARRTPAVRRDDKPTMATLKPAERRMWEHREASKIWGGSEEAFLKTVERTRRLENNG